MIEMNERQKKLLGDLTSLQREIALNSISGMTDIDSYRNSKGKAKDIKSMEASVSEILSNLKVREFIDSMAETRVNPAIMSRTEMMERLSNLARTNMSDLIEWGPGELTDSNGEKITQSVWSIKESAKLDSNKMSSISEVVAGKDGLKIKQHSPLAAMKQLADIGGYNAAKEIEGNITINKANEDDW